jgi:transposase
MSTTLCIGIDVSKKHLDVAIDNEATVTQYTNDQDGIDAIIERIKPLAIKLVVFEATGGYEALAASCLHNAGLPIVIVNPRQIRDFAKATGVLAKTDAIDAQVICRFARAVNPKQRTIKDAETSELAALVTRRRQLIKMLVAEQNRLQQASKRNQKDIKDHIKWLKKRLDKIDDQIRKDIENSPMWHVKDDLLQSCPGVGPVTSAKLLSGVPELGQLDRKAIAMLIGLAPLNRDSGKFKGSRRIWGGRSEIRSALYMAAMSAIKHNPKIREFYQRLTAAGKCHKVAITACMRKLLIILNAMVRDQNKWQHT